MIRSSDRKSVAASPSTCFEETPQPSLGIAFERRDGSRRFSPYSFLAAIDFDGSGEMVFRFSSWSVTVRGDALLLLWKAACAGCLARVRVTSDAAKDGEPAVREIIFAEANDGHPFAGPPFPADSEPLPAR